MNFHHLARQTDLRIYAVCALCGPTPNFGARRARDLTGRLRLKCRMLVTKCKKAPCATLEILNAIEQNLFRSR